MISLITEDWRIDNIETVLFDKDGTFIDLHFEPSLDTRNKSHLIMMCNPFVSS